MLWFLSQLTAMSSSQHPDSICWMVSGGRCSSCELELAIDLHRAGKSAKERHSTNFQSQAADLVSRPLLDVDLYYAPDDA
jgi:hypothetical protein